MGSFHSNRWIESGNGHILWRLKMDFFRINERFSITFLCRMTSDISLNKIFIKIINGYIKIKPIFKKTIPQTWSQMILPDEVCK